MTIQTIQPQKQNVIVYKAIREAGMLDFGVAGYSCYADGFTKHRYKKNQWTYAEQSYLKQGYGLFVFQTKTQAIELANVANVRIWECEAIQMPENSPDINELPFLFELDKTFNKTMIQQMIQRKKETEQKEKEQKNFYLKKSHWPRGTIVVQAVKLITKVN